jgi:hypothetical protein
MERTYRVLYDAVEVTATIVATATVGDVDLGPCPIAVAHVARCVPSAFFILRAFRCHPRDTPPLPVFVSPCLLASLPFPVPV